MRHQRVEAMNIPVDSIFLGDGQVVTANYRRSGRQTRATVWASRMFTPMDLHLVSGLEVSLPVSSERRAGDALGELLTNGYWSFLRSMAAPLSDYQMDLLPPKGERVPIALLHLSELKKSLTDDIATAVEATARDYRLLVEFGVSTPGTALARAEGVAPKTIQQRIFHAREQGLLPSHGRGRTSKSAER